MIKIGTARKGPKPRRKGSGRKGKGEKVALFLERGEGESEDFGGVN